MATQSWLRIAESNGYVHGHRPVETDVDLQDADPGDVELGPEGFDVEEGFGGKDVRPDELKRPPLRSLFAFGTNL